MKITIEFSTENESFRAGAVGEMSRVLDGARAAIYNAIPELVALLRDPGTMQAGVTKKIHDSNGNACGKVTVEDNS